MSTNFGVGISFVFVIVVLNHSNLRAEKIHLSAHHCPCWKTSKECKCFRCRLLNWLHILNCSTNHSFYFKGFSSPEPKSHGLGCLKISVQAACSLGHVRPLICRTSSFIMQLLKITASKRGRINMMFICLTKIKHISSDQIKTAFRFWCNTTSYNMPTTSIKKRYMTSSGAILKQCHANKQKDFSSVLHKNRWGCWQNKQDGSLQTHSLSRKTRYVFVSFFE